MGRALESVFNDIRDIFMLPDDVFTHLRSKRLPSFDTFLGGLPAPFRGLGSDWSQVRPDLTKNDL